MASDIENLPHSYTDISGEQVNDSEERDDEVVDKTNDKDDNANIDTGTGISNKESEARFIEWYEDICQERIVMSEKEEEYRTQIKEYQEAETSYQKRINELESNVTDLVKAFDEVQSEAKLLRTKYEPPVDDSNKDAYAEPYNIVVTEKAKLLETQKQHQDKIKTLEGELELLRKYIKDLETVHEVKPAKKPERRRKSIVVITNSERLQALEQENTHLKYLNDKAESERRALSVQVSTLETRLKQIELTSAAAKKLKVMKRVQSDFSVNKKCVPTFLPRIKSWNTNDATSDGSDTKSTRSSVTLDYGGYRYIHNKRRSMSTDSAYQSIYKYMV